MKALQERKVVFELDLVRTAGVCVCVCVCVFLIFDSGNILNPKLDWYVDEE